jgi:hypothetical protein
MLMVNIKDANFAHHPPGQSMSYRFYPTYFQWDRSDNIVSDSLFITDRYIPEADRFHAKRKIAMLIEPPIISPATYEYVNNNHKNFDYILTYSKELLDTGRNFLFYSACCSWISDDSMPVKTKVCSMVASNKMMTKGHVFRAEVIEKFKGRMEHFGLGYKHIETKEEGLRDFCFSIVMENSDTDYYFSEKLIDCFMTRTIPIYWGSDLSKYFDMNGVLTFKSIEDLKKIMNSLSVELYMSKLQSVENNFNKAQDFKIPEDWLYKTYPFLFS